MRTTLKHLSLLCASAMLLACAGVGQRAAAPPLASSARMADDAYALGRAQHLARRYDEAIQSYRFALATDPTHVNARNGLATVYAEQGDFAQAIPIWRTMTEQAGHSSGPADAFLFSNLGYAYFLNGQYEPALAALEKACLLDPLSHRAWQHLGSALQRLGQEERAQLMYRQASALREHDFRDDYTAAGGGKGVAPIDTAVKAPARPEREWAATDVSVRADGMLELRRIPAAALSTPSAAPAPAPPPTPAPPPASPAMQELALVEIRNGNGVTGMAKTLAAKMGDPGLKVVRLSNQKGFKVRQTRVEYQPAFRAAALRLANRFSNAAVLEVDDCNSSDLRLVIGHDLVGEKVVLRPLAHPTLAVNAGPDGPA